MNHGRSRKTKCAKSIIDQKIGQKRRKAEGRDFPLIQVIHSAATTLSGMLNLKINMACLTAGMGACHRSKSDGVSGYDVVHPHVLVMAARKGRRGCLMFTARLDRKVQSSHRDQAVSEVRSTAAQIGTLDRLKGQ